MAMLNKKMKKLKNWLQNRKNLQKFRIQLAKLKSNFSFSYQVVLITHELSATGAPLMLLNAANAILRDGGGVRVLSYLDGPLRHKFEALGCAVFYLPDFRDNAKLLNEFGGDCAYGVANTVVTYPAVNLLKGTKLLWWIHEAQIIEKDYIARFRKKKIRPDLEQTLKSAPKLAVVSEYAKEVVAKYNQRVEVITLAEADVAAEKGLIPKQAAEKIRFAMLGAVSEIKGQDIVAKAVRNLPQAYRSQIEFHIAGRQDSEFASRLMAENDDLPEIIWEPGRNNENLWSFYCENDVIVVASRDESFSLVALEACMAARPLIVSSNVGAKFLVEPGVNGAVFESGSAEAVQGAIVEMINQRSRLAEMGAASRRCFEKNGSLENFQKRFLELLKK